MKVLHVMAAGEGGGAQHLLALLPVLRQLGVESEAAVGEVGPLAGALRQRGFQVHGVDLFRARTDPTAALRLARLVREVQPDLVHWHGTRAAFFGALARPLLGRAPPTVYTVHGLSYRKEMGAAGRATFLAAELFACRSADRVITVSRADLEDLENRRFVGSTSAVHVPNGVDLERFRPGDRETARAPLGLDPTAFVVGTVSRLVPGKAVGDLISAVARLQSAVLLIVGDGPERTALEGRAQSLGVGERVHFLGARDDIPQVLCALDVFALASRWEGEPVSLLEAMASGLPCVATATEGARELLEGTEAGVLVPIGAVSNLASALDQIASTTFHRSRMGQAARRAVEGRTVENMAGSVERVYGGLAWPV